MSKKISKLIVFAVCALIPSCLIFDNFCFAANNKSGLTDLQLNEFSQNDILFYDPSECLSRGVNAESCFKINNNVGVQDFWYAEGCLNTGDCTGGLYFASGQSPGSDNGLVVTGNNPWIYNDTKVDDDWGGCSISMLKIMTLSTIKEPIQR